MTMNLTDLTLAAQRRVEVLFGACAFADPVWAQERCSWLPEEMILDERIRKFWHGLQNGKKGNAAGAALEAGCFADLAQAVTEVPNLSMPEAYAEEIRRRAWLAGQDRALANLMEARRTNDVEGMQEAVRSLGSSAPPTEEALPTAETIGVEFQDFLNSDMAADVIPTHIVPLDRALGGFERRKFAVLAARPAMGKSTLAFQVARNVARDRRVLYFSNEMSARALWAKAACGAVGLKWRDVIAKRATAEQMDRLRDASNEFMCQYEDRLVIDDRASHTSDSLWRVVARHRPALVVVDVIANLRDRGESEIRRLAAIVRNLKAMGKELNPSMLAIHHTNRESEKEDRRPRMSDLRDSGNVEQDADVLLMLYSPDYAKVNEGGMAPPRYLRTTCIVAKDREGPRNVACELAYDTERQWFEAAADVWPL